MKVYIMFGHLNKLNLPAVSIPAPRASIAIIVGTIESFPHLTEMSSNPGLEYVTPSDKLGQHGVVIGVVHVHLLQRLRHLPKSVVAFNQVWWPTYYESEI